MRINIIIPNYNKEQFLEKCLLSCLNQDHKDYKVIFIDNESTDNSLYIAENVKSKGYDFVIDSAKNIYPRCWDECLEQAKQHLDGDFCTIIGSDDYINNNYLSNFESWAKNKNEKVYQSALNWYKDGQKINTVEHTYENIDELKSKLSVGCCVNSLFFIVRRYLKTKTFIDSLSYIVDQLTMIFYAKLLIVVFL